MAVDPETGIITPDVTRQPLGAMGAILGLSNAQRATDIADTLQAQRRTQLLQEQEQERQRQADIDRETQMREAIGNLYAQGHQPTMDELQKAVLPYAKSPESLLPWFRGSTAAKGRVDAAKINALGAIGKQRIAAGESPQSVLTSMGSMLGTPEEQEAFKSTLTGVPSTALPVPESKAGLNRSLGGLADTKAQIALEKAPEEIAVLQATAELKRANAQLAGYKAKGGSGKLSKSAVNQLSALYQRALKARDAFINRKPQVDPNTGLAVREKPEQKAANDATLAKMNAELQTLGEELKAARASDSTPPAGGSTAAPALSPEAQALMPS